MECNKSEHYVYAVAITSIPIKLRTAYAITYFCISDWVGDVKKPRRNSKKINVTQVRVWIRSLMKIENSERRL